MKVWRLRSNAQGEIMLAEMVPDIESATARAEVVRRTLLETGLSAPADE